MNSAMYSEKESPATEVGASNSGVLPIIGWREWIAIPTLKIDRIKAKIDTGARSSSIHALEVRKYVDRGAPYVSFVICPEQGADPRTIACVAELRDERIVKSSSGHEQNRYLINAMVRLGNLTWPIELTLADRTPMGFNMLLGREAIRGRFLVDAGRSFIAGDCLADGPIAHS